MILVRDIFQVKFGRMKEAKDIWKEMFKLMPAQGGSKPRLLTDLTGQYYTLVMESTFKDLTDYDSFMKQGMGTPEMGVLYGKFVPLVDSGSREIFTILD
jgi:hypothetical protein